MDEPSQAKLSFYHSIKEATYETTAFVTNFFSTVLKSIAIAVVVSCFLLASYTTVSQLGLPAPGLVSILLPTLVGAITIFFLSFIESRFKSPHC